LLIVIQSYLIAAESIPFQKKIILIQGQDFIAYPGDLAVLEDEYFFICDIKDQKLMLYDQNGRFQKLWKTIGQAPGEYQGVWLNDYDRPYLGVYDLRARKLLIYRRVGLTEFKWIRDIHEIEGYVYDFKLHNERIYFDTPILFKNQYYFIHIVDFNEETDEYCLPAAVRYGQTPESDFRKPDGKFRALWGPPRPFMDVFEGYIYSAWKGMLNILKIDIATKEWTSFGHKTKTYSQPKTWNITGKDYKIVEKWREENEHKCSWTAGIFVDNGLVGLIYLNYDEKQNCWAPILQLYDDMGVFLKEMSLAGAQAVYTRLIYNYSRDLGSLYILNMVELNSGEVEYNILKYQIRE